MIIRWCLNCPDADAFIFVALCGDVYSVCPVHAPVVHESMESGSRIGIFAKIVFRNDE